MAPHFLHTVFLMIRKSVSYFSDGEPNGYLMTMIVGVATGSVSLLFCSFTNYLEQIDAKEQRKVRKAARKKR